MCGHHDKSPQCSRYAHIVRSGGYEERGGLSKLVTLASKASPSATNTFLMRLDKMPDQAFTLQGRKEARHQQVIPVVTLYEKYRAKHGDDGFADSIRVRYIRYCERERRYRTGTTHSFDQASARRKEVR
ncbi:hypothetical protein JG688_00017228 [Phytophthora aleatoria]|uniref:Uncharacterized protein n=1 Tax=Phytophthora aleatoria TaxID=2496075 RepID=A0A8J5LYP2_9STRA|nr:hypothetical protein JG688_00017228 [Phytophthora aleatoria]